MLIVEKVALDQQVSDIAKNLLLNKTCKTCTHFQDYVVCDACSCLTRAKRLGITASTSGWDKFEKYGLDFPKENTCVDWQLYEYLPNEALKKLFNTKEK